MTHPPHAEPGASTQGGFGARTASGAVYAALSQATKVVCTMMSTIVVARLLSPEDYGIVAMTAPVMGFLLIFQTFGLNHAVVQRREISSDELSTLFWFNVLSSAGIAAILLAISPLVGSFFGDVRAGYVTAASSLTVILSGLGLQHAALLSRDLRFSTLSIVAMSEAVLGLLSTVTLALALESFWALWGGALIGTTANTLMLWTMHAWRPRMVFRPRGTASMIGFGASVTGFSLLNFLARNLDNVLIAKVWGALQVGLYDRAYKLMMFPLQHINLPLGRVIVPVLSKLADEPTRYRKAFTLSLRAISVATVPGIAAATFTSAELVPLLLGDRWAAAAPVFFWLGLSGLLQPLTNTTGWLFLSRGEGGRMLKWGLLISVTTIAAVVIGLRWGPVGVAMAYCLNDYLVRTPSSFYLSTRDNAVRTRDFYTTLFPLMLATVATWATVAVMRPHLPPVALILGALACAYVYAIALQCVSREGRDMLQTLQGLLRRSPVFTGNLLRARG